MLFWELRVIEHQILCTLILTDDSLTLDSLYQKTSGQITAITARDMKYLRRKGEILWLMQINQKPGSSDIHLEDKFSEIYICMKLWIMYACNSSLQFIYMYFNFSSQKIRRRKPDTCHCVGRVWCGNSQRERTAVFRHQTTGKFIRYGVFQSPLINVGTCTCTYGHKNLINFSVNICMYIKAT